MIRKFESQHGDTPMVIKVFLSLDFQDFDDKIKIKNNSSEYVYTKKKVWCMSLLEGRKHKVLEKLRLEKFL